VSHVTAIIVAMIECCCPHCDYTHEIADELAGESVLCPNCHCRFRTGKSGPSGPMITTLCLLGASLVGVIAIVYFLFNDFRKPTQEIISTLLLGLGACIVFLPALGAGQLIEKPAVPRGADTPTENRSECPS
jgi:hypothetical protein